MRDVYSYLILELTTALVTLGLGFAQVGPLNYNPVTAAVLAVTVVTAHMGLFLISFPSMEIRSHQLFKYWPLFGVPVVISFTFTMYACIASWTWTGVPQLSL